MSKRVARKRDNIEGHPLIQICTQMKIQKVQFTD